MLRRYIAVALGLGGSVASAAAFTNARWAHADPSKHTFSKYSSQELTQSVQQMTAMIKTMQNDICAEAEKLEAAENVSGQVTKFVEDFYERENGGFSITRIISNGKVFEKGAVNLSVSVVPTGPRFFQKMVQSHPRLQRYLDENRQPRLLSASLSLILHPLNPYAPTVHANVRQFALVSPPDAQAGAPAANVPTTYWFGGGTDLTPHYLFEEDCKEFHSELKKACDKHDASYYARFKKWCDQYFYIPHRKEARGIGGVFWDDESEKPPAELQQFSADVLQAFINSYFPIVKRRTKMPYGEEQRKWQEIRHGRYVEFNLVCDKGTKYGLETSSARTESVLASMPTTARFEYMYKPSPGSPEEQMQKVVSEPPREWV